VFGDYDRWQFRPGAIPWVFAVARLSGLTHNYRSDVIQYQTKIQPAKNINIPDWDKPESKFPLLINGIARVLNIHGIDSGLCVPDFILAEMLVKNLCTFAKLNKQTEKWRNE